MNIVITASMVQLYVFVKTNNDLANNLKDLSSDEKILNKYREGESPDSHNHYVSGSKYHYYV